MTMLVAIILLYSLTIVLFKHMITVGVHLAEPAIGRISSRGKRSLAWLVYLAVSGAITWPIVMYLLPRLPDFRQPGDGGFGMVQNAIAPIATVLLCLAAILLVTGAWLWIAFSPEPEYRLEENDPDEQEFE